MLALLLAVLLAGMPALAERVLTTNGGTEIPLEQLAHRSEDAASTVYFASDITPDALAAAYRALGVELPGKVGVKLSTGESERSNFLRPALIGDLVQALGGTIVECNTAYGGSRASTAMHLQLAKDRGFADIAEVDILDAEGSMELPVDGGLRLGVDYVGGHFANYDSYLVLSHFKGHAMAGFGGAIKNISIGFGSAMGKVWIHSGGTRTTGGIFGEQDPFLEAMADAAKGVHTFMNGNIAYISVMNRLSVDCDCDGSPAEPDMHDIGILASTDPLALDQACIDLVYAAPDSASLVKRIESRNGLHVLESGEAVGLGSRAYRLEVIGD
uniref:Fe-S protein n=1 Tax=uncultured bacterium Contig575 TaxID=1393592 RepID=W0FNG0_9BACT|nr:Fe-S protein [uncultured bacterium Contig575]